METTEVILRSVAQLDGPWKSPALGLFLSSTLILQLECNSCACGKPLCFLPSSRSVVSKCRAIWPTGSHCLSTSRRILKSQFKIYWRFWCFEDKGKLDWTNQRWHDHQTDSNLFMGFSSKILDIQVKFMIYGDISEKTLICKSVTSWNLLVGTNCTCTISILRTYKYLMKAEKYTHIWSMFIRGTPHAELRRSVGEDPFYLWTW